MTPSPSEISSLLTDVRKSYRLLHDYQRLILDSLKYVGTQLNIPYRGGWTIFCGNQTRNGRGDLDKWAWDWLGMYAYEFRFDLRHDNNRGLDIPEHDFVTIAASVISDTGYYHVAEDHPDKTRVEDFQPAEASQSKIIFSVFRGPWRGLGYLYEPETLKSVLQEGGVWPKNSTAEGLHGFTDDISVLFERIRADQVVDRILALAKSHDLPIYKTGQSPKELEEADSGL